MKKGEIMVADYPIGKSVVLNAIYDMTERMDIRLIESDSRKGHIRFREKSGQYDGSIDITSQKNAEGLYTRIELERVSSEEVGQVLMDEIRSGMRSYFNRANSADDMNHANDANDKDDMNNTNRANCTNGANNSNNKNIANTN